LILPELLRTFDTWAGQFRTRERDQCQELLDTLRLSEVTVARAYRDLARLQGWLGNTAEILRLIKTDRLPVRRVLDIGCGRGALLAEVRRKLGMDVVGVDLREAPAGTPVPIISANAVTDPLPSADIAISVCMAHHLSPHEVRGMIANVSRSCRRLIILDLVRHPLPLALFTAFVAPLLTRLNAADGKTSIRRAFTPDELGRIAETAASETGGRVRRSVAPLYTRQVVDISW
jgi:2-polyprenyl-3-methyl-5-hydroxy-6-metoxy-1,4-benzoquinol methylase